jgi:hypothetical protein
MNIIKNILMILFATFIDFNMVILSIVAFKISTIFGIIIAIGVVYIIILSIVVLINYLKMGD